MALQPKIQPASGICAELNIAIDDYIGPVSYTTGGVTVSASAFQLQKIKYLSFTALSASGNFSTKEISPKKGSAVFSVVIKWFTAAGAEVNPGTNLSGESVRYHAIGV
jgi:hypothetical protein